MLYDDVINDQDYVGLKRITEDRELRKYNRRAVATKIRVNVLTIRLPVFVAHGLKIRADIPLVRLPVSIARVLQIRVDVPVPQDLRWQAEVLTIRADRSLNK